jgi:hypothetical protein
MTKNPPAVQHLEAQIAAWAQARLAELREQAEAEALGFIEADRVLRAGTGKPRGKLTIRVREVRGRGTPGAFSVDWLVFWYVQDKDKKRVYRTRYIPRGHGEDRYRMNAFAGRIKNWQRPLVAETEARLAQIRAEARKVSAVRTAYREAERARTKRLGRGAGNSGAN